MMMARPTRSKAVTAVCCGIKGSENAKLPRGTMTVKASHKMLAEPYFKMKMIKML